MRRSIYSLAIALNAVGLTLIAGLLPGLAVAPQIVRHPLLAQIDRADSLPQLERLQQQVQQALEEVHAPRFTRDMGELTPYFTLAQVAYRVNQRIEMEEAAEANYRRAQELVTQAIATRDAVREAGEETVQALQQQEYLLESALQQLDKIPEDSILAAQAARKAEEYSAILAPIAARTDEQNSGFLQEIAEATGRPEAIRISICHLSGECRNYQGDVPPASPASLIKVPVAVALMDKVDKEGIDLDSIVYIDPHNWTENADGAKIYVDHEYPLREVMVRMIKESNNIATNQLSDYIGWEAMNETLADRGFSETRVNTKLAGDNTLPSYNRASGNGPNTMTTNEVTEMMRQIYTFAHPGDEEILDALVGQYDWEFGYTAVKEVRSKRVAWIGEKTGQNSKVIGSSLAVKIDNERYVMTVTIDYSGNQEMLRQVIRETIQHILENDHFVETTRR
jgi:beta-lactamase class A